MSSEPDHSPPDPARGVLHGREELRDRFVIFFERAEREIRLYAPVLEAYLFNTEAMTNRLADFVAGHARNRARILVEEVDATLRTNDRIVELARRFSDAIRIHEIGPEDRGLREIYLGVDRASYVLQADVTRPEAMYDTAGGVEAARLTLRFDEMWDRSAPVTGLHPLGL